MRALPVIVASVLALPCAALGQNDAELAVSQLKDARRQQMPSFSLPLRSSQLTLPSITSVPGEVFGYRLFVGGVVKPVIFEDETWIMVGCLANDPRVMWDDDEHGFPAGVRARLHL